MAIALKKAGFTFEYWARTRWARRAAYAIS
jgi:hypothetical protein